MSDHPVSDHPVSDPVSGEVFDVEVGDCGASGKRRVAAPVAVLVALVLGALVFLLAAGGGEGDSAATPLLNRLAPDSTGVYDDGSTFELSRRKGSWVVLNFFTHDCIPCILEHDDLIEFVDQQRSLGTEGAEFYSIVQVSTREQTDAFFAERGGDWPVVYDDDHEFQIDFGVNKVPETWVIDPSGIVRLRLISTVEADTLSRTIQSFREAGL
ncbi:MAG TPA: TlpA disulfide reductase family protein [Ilumatobacter sp.]|nr:TlpA disulfide reductase family protein [Ilumatobacter sp.]